MRKRTRSNRRRSISTRVASRRKATITNNSRPKCIAPGKVTDGPIPAVDAGAGGTAAMTSRSTAANGASHLSPKFRNVTDFIEATARYRVSVPGRPAQYFYSASGARTYAARCTGAIIQDRIDAIPLFIDLAPLETITRVLAMDPLSKFTGDPTTGGAVWSGFFWIQERIRELKKTMTNPVASLQARTEWVADQMSRLQLYPAPTTE